MSDKLNPSSAVQVEKPRTWDKIDNLQQAIDETERLLNGLEDRLQSVMVPPFPEVEGKEMQEPSMSSLTSNINAKASQMWHIAHRLEDIRKRLEV
jgi:hypothetical protein